MTINDYVAQTNGESVVLHLLAACLFSMSEPIAFTLSEEEDVHVDESAKLRPGELPWESWKRDTPLRDSKTLFRWSGQKPKEGEDDDAIATDRPDFTEATINVGKGRLQLEMGYTFSRNREAGVMSAHSYPEMLLRAGVYADWLELRIGQNFGSAKCRDTDGRPFGLGGAEDLYLGIGLGFTEQAGILPESRLLIQATVPTGANQVGSGKTLPGLNYLYGWEVNEFLSVAASSQANSAIDDEGHRYLELAQSLTVGYALTKKLGAYTEWFAFFPSGASAPNVTALHYLDGGFTYKVTPNFQLDIRAGVGLSRQADDFFGGTGFGVRY